MTREEAIARIKDHKIIHKMNEPRAIYISEALDMAIKALKQESVLDKIRAEIEAIIGERNLDDYEFCSGLICARKILDKCKAESEGEG